jgi:flavin-dependent dehydrogenase
MACSELLFHEDGAVKGVVAGEFGKNADGSPSEAYEPGMELNGKYVFLSEGVRGSLSKQVIAKYNLDADLRCAQVWPWYERDLGSEAGKSQPGRSDPFHGLADGASSSLVAPSCIIWKTIKSMSALLLI